MAKKRPAQVIAPGAKSKQAEDTLQSQIVSEQVTTERLPEFAAALQSFCIHLILTSAGQATTGCVDAELACEQRSVSSPLDAVAGRRPGTGCESRWMHCCRWRSATTALKF